MYHIKVNSLLKEKKIEKMSSKSNTNYRKAVDITDDQQPFLNIINRYIAFFTREIQKQSTNDTSSEYPFVAMDTRQAFQEIKLAWDYLAERGGSPGAPPPTFLDIGCGIGNVLLFAEQVGFDIYGIEKDQYPFYVASRMLGSGRISQDDILDYDRYGDFDVVYYFCPLTDGALQKNFELQVENSLRPGAILIANYKRSDKIKQDPRFRKLNIDLPVWEKISK